MNTSSVASTDSLSVAEITLVLHDLDRMEAFYRDTVGLTTLAADGAERLLGANDRPLLRLRADRHERRGGPREAGLFHVAFLLPERRDLGAWIRRTLARRHPHLSGAADHGVSEAFYLRDPEDNGIEVYADRPRDRWQWTHDYIAVVTEALDVDDVIAAADTAWRGAPENTRIGHVHLQVGDIAAAETFYRDTLGFNMTQRLPSAAFFGTGGYHHQIAANSWNSRGAAARKQPLSGLAAINLQTANAGAFDQLGAEAIDCDPSGVRINLT